MYEAILGDLPAGSGLAYMVTSRHGPAFDGLKRDWQAFNDGNMTAAVGLSSVTAASVKLALSRAPTGEWAYVPDWHQWLWRKLVDAGRVMFWIRWVLWLGFDS
jgi:mannose/cellobiose epimerase-like protein (N-acyl-D-glucosamine 2-epimerase family)